jgi:hypothetical protein
MRGPRRTCGAADGSFPGACRSQNGRIKTASCRPRRSRTAVCNALCLASQHLRIESQCKTRVRAGQGAGRGPTGFGYLIPSSGQTQTPLTRKDKRPCLFQRGPYGFSGWSKKGHNNGFGRMRAAGQQLRRDARQIKHRQGQWDQKGNQPYAQLENKSKNRRIQKQSIATSTWRLYGVVPVHIEQGAS